MKKELLLLLLISYFANFGVSSLPFNTNKSIERNIANKNNILIKEEGEKSIKWKNLDDGLRYSKINIYSFNGEIMDKVNVIEINPEKYFFDFLYDGYLRKIENWQKDFNAPIVFNGSYYDRNYKPTTLVIKDGRIISRQFSENTKIGKGGIFVSNPILDGINRADIIIPYDGVYVKDILEKYNFVIQGIPVLLDNDRIKVAKSDWLANRTVLAIDNKNNVLVFNTEGTKKYYSFSLNEFAEWLRDYWPGNKIMKAINLDGGYEACFVININKNKFFSYGQYETNERNITIPGVECYLPFAIGVYKK